MVIDFWEYWGCRINGSPLIGYFLRMARSLVKGTGAGTVQATRWIAMPLPTSCITV